MKSQARFAATLVVLGVAFIGGAVWLAEDSTALLDAGVSRISAPREPDLLAAAFVGIGLFLAALGSLFLIMRWRGRKSDLGS